MTPDRSPAFLSVREVMARLKKRHGFVRGLIENGTLETRDIEGVARITATSYDRYVGRASAVPDDITVLIDQRIAAALESAVRQLRGDA